jgi:hypothetical protein
MIAYQHTTQMMATWASSTSSSVTRHGQALPRHGRGRTLARGRPASSPLSRLRNWRQ